MSPGGTPAEGYAGPIDYTKYDGIKQEAVDLTMADSAPGISPPSSFAVLPLRCVCVTYPWFSHSKFICIAPLLDCYR